MPEWNETPMVFKVIWMAFWTLVGIGVAALAIRWWERKQ